MAKKRRSKWVIVACLSIFAVAMIAFFVWSSRPVVEQIEVTDVQGASTAEYSVKALEGVNFSTSISEDLVVKSHNKAPHANIIEQILLTSTSSTLNNPVGDQLGISIGEVPSDGLQGVSDVQLRTRHPEKYQSTASTKFPPDSKAFVNTENGYEISIFWTHDSRYAALVVSGTSARATQLNSLVSTVLENWQWQAK